MSEHWPEFGSDQPNVEPEATGSSSANGAHPEEAVAVAEGAAEDPVGAEGGTADGSPAVAEITDESATSEAAEDVAVATDAGSDDGAIVAATADDRPAVEATADDGVAVAAAADGSQGDRGKPHAGAYRGEGLPRRGNEISCQRITGAHVRLQDPNHGEQIDLRTWRGCGAGGGGREHHHPGRYQRRQHASS